MIIRVTAALVSANVLISDSWAHVNSAIQELFRRHNANFTRFDHKLKWKVATNECNYSTEQQFLEQETEIEFRFSRIIHAFCLIASLYVDLQRQLSILHTGHEVGLRLSGLVEVPARSTRDCIDLCLFFILHLSSVLFDSLPTSCWMQKRTVRFVMGTVNSFSSPSPSSHVSTTLNTTNINYSWRRRKPRDN